MPQRGIFTRMQQIERNKTRNTPRAVILQAFRRQSHALKTVLSAFLLGMFMTSHLATAATIEGVTFADEVAIGPNEETRLRLRGKGLLRYRVIFRGYVGALYLPAGVPGTSALEDIPRKLELSYFWAIEASQFAETAENFLKQTMSTVAFNKLQARIENLHNAYRDVRPSDRYALTYQPGIGTTLYLNDESLVTIRGADFAKAYFGIWLGTPSVNDQFRDSLLNEP
jgi:hypothetical protein